MLLFPALWAVSEWVRSWLLSGFPWLSIGYSQVPSSPLAGYAPVLGVYGVSLVTAAVAGAAAFAVDGFIVRRQPGPFSTSIRGAGVAAALVIGGAALQAHQWTQPVSGAPTSVTLLQGNIPQELKWRPERAVATLETYLELARSADSKLIVLPETALPMLDVDVPPAYLQALTGLAAKNGGDILYGIPELDPDGSYYNSVMSVGTGPAQTYRKHHLVPFGDYFPLRPVLGWIMKLLHIPMSDFSHGAAVQKPMRVAGQKVAVNICYEDAFGEEIIRQLPEATMLANFTNDAWWGDTIASRQHLQIAQMRALETGRPMLRATNTGVTAIIGPDGRIIASAAEFTTTKVTGEVHGYQGSTPYVRWGNYAFLVVSVLMILIGVYAGRMKIHHRGTEAQRTAKNKLIGAGVRSTAVRSAHIASLPISDCRSCHFSLCLCVSVVKFGLLHVGEALLLQVDDFRIRHRHHGDEAVDVFRLESAPARRHPAHADVDDAADGEALRAQHQVAVFPDVADGEEVDLVAVQHDDDLAVERIRLVQRGEVTRRSSTFSSCATVLTATS